MINFLQNLREKQKYLLQIIGQCIEQQTARIRICYSQLWTTGETDQKITFPADLWIQWSSNKMPQLHKTEYSYRILSRLNSYTLPAFYWRIIDQVVIIVAKHSKTAYRIISEHLHCTVCHQIPLLGFRSLPDPPLGEFNITVSQNWFSFYLHNASINRTHYRLSRHQ